MGVDTKHIKDIASLEHAKSLAGQYYVRAKKAEAKRDEVIRKNVELSEKIISLSAKLGQIHEIVNDETR